MWNWEFLSPKPLQSSSSLHHDSPITSGIRSQSDLYGYGSSEDRVPAFYFFTQLISTSYAISCPWALYICIWFNWNHVVCQLSKQKSPRSSDNSNDTRQRYAWRRIMCSTEERDLIHPLYLHRFLSRGTKQSPSIDKSLVVQYSFVRWTTFLYILFVRHSCYYMPRASWIPLPKFRLFIHNAVFTDPFLNRERKRDCWNISGWG